MKYIKLFEDKEYDKSIIKSNKKLIDLVYTIISLEEDLKDNGFIKDSFRNDETEFHSEYSLVSQSLDSESILKKIDKNIDIEIPTLTIRMNCVVKSTYKEGIIEELDQIIIGLKQRIVDFSPNTRVNTINKIIEIIDIEKFEHGEHRKSKKIKIKLGIELLDKKSTRYT